LKQTCRQAASPTGTGLCRCHAVPTHVPCPTHSPRPDPLTLTGSVPSHAALRCLSAPCRRLPVLIRLLKQLKTENDFSCHSPLPPGMTANGSLSPRWFFHLLLQVVLARSRPACGSIRMLQGMMS